MPGKRTSSTGQLGMSGRSAFKNSMGESKTRAWSPSELRRSSSDPRMDGSSSIAKTTHCGRSQMPLR
jgi:hypothetical protein